jgi:hypothetical protein
MVRGSTACKACIEKRLSTSSRRDIWWTSASHLTNSIQPDDNRRRTSLIREWPREGKRRAAIVPNPRLRQLGSRRANHRCHPRGLAWPRRARNNETPGWTVRWTPSAHIPRAFAARVYAFVCI